MRTMLAAVDLSRHAHSVVGRAAELASLLRADLVLLTGLDPDPMRKFSLGEERNRISSFHKELIFKHFDKNGLSLEFSDPDETVYVYKTAGIRIHLKTLPGNPVDSICSMAEQLKADLVIVGNKGLGGLGGLILGSVSERVVHKCQRTVMVVKGEAPEKSDRESIMDSHQTDRNVRTR